MGRGEKAHPTILVATLYIYATGWHRPEALADNGSRNLKDHWSGREDSNIRPLRPERIDFFTFLPGICVRDSICWAILGPLATM